MSNREYITETFVDGDTFVEYESDQVVASGMVHVTITLPVLRNVEKIVTVHCVDTDPSTTIGGISNIKLTQATAPGNATVGMTLENMGNSTTISLNVAYVGF